MTIRPIHSSEYLFLEEMLYEAIFIPQGEARVSKDIIYVPEIYKYIKDFGRPSDLCLVAELNQTLAGAAWIRFFNENNKAYGYINATTPELSIAIQPDFRNAGIGSKLMDELFAQLIHLGINQVSLSVDIRNPAHNLYLRYDFKEFKREGNSVTMLKEL